MKLISRVLLAIVLGITITLYYMQYDARFIISTEAKLCHLFQTMFNCNAQYTLKQCSAVPIKLVAEDVTVSAPDKKAWYWNAQSLTFNSSWLMVLLNRRMGLDIILNNMHAYSAVHNGVIAIAGHLKKLILEAQDLPLFLKSLAIRKGCLEVYDPTTTLEGIIPFSSESLVIANCMRTTLYITDGTVSWWSMPFVQNLLAQIRMKKNDIRSPGDVTVYAEGQCDLSFLPSDQQDCYLSVACNDSSCSLRIRNKTDSFLGTMSYDLEGNNIDIRGRIPLDYINQVFNISPHIGGTCVLSMQIDTSMDEPVMHGTLTIDNIVYKGHPLGTVVIEVEKNNESYTGMFTINLNEIGEIKGDLLWDEQHKVGKIHCCNTETIRSIANYWEILPHDLQIDCSYDNSYSCTGNFNGVGTHAKLGSRVVSKGAFSFDSKDLVASGVFDSYPFDIKATVSSRCMLEHIMIRDQHDNQLIHIFSSNKKDHAFEGDINYSCVRSLLENLFDTDMKGEGILHINGDIHDSIATCSVRMTDVNIQVPHTYNFIHSVQGDLSVDVANKKIVAQDFLVALHKGTIRSKRATVRWGDKKGLFIHVPLLIEKMFINMQRDVFAEVSGALLLYQYAHDPVCKGSIIIDRGECKKNIFASSLQKNLLNFMHNPASSSYNLGCNLAIKTKEPLHIQTSFLQTDAALSLVVKNNFSDPHILGSISLISGTLKFPYRDLYITRGSLYFLPNQLDDPAIELIAKGKIKKYHITMSISGSLQNPHVSFESIPSLNEEQIITLLLAGSQEGSFALVMPALVMQNVQALLFDPEQTSSTLDYYFKNLLSPLKHIRIVPSFVDQTGRGGFRGAIEIDVSDQLHALIQKNFSLSEDSKFEIEYFLSDDMSVRGIKDERGDLGGEVEMRWKF